MFALKYLTELYVILVIPSSHTLLPCQHSAGANGINVAVAGKFADSTEKIVYNACTYTWPSLQSRIRTAMINVRLQKIMYLRMFIGSIWGSNAPI